MIRAHIAAPQSGGLPGLRSELQAEDGPGPKTPGTPKPASAANSEAVPSGAGVKRPSGAALENAIGPKRLTPTAAEPTVASLLALARSSGDESPPAAHRMLEAVQHGSLRQTQSAWLPPTASASTYRRKTADAAVPLDPMCCVGCKAVAEFIDSSGLNAFYKYRDRPDTELNLTPEESDWLRFDSDDLLNRYVFSDDGRAEATLDIPQLVSLPQPLVTSEAVRLM